MAPTGSSHSMMSVVSESSGGYVSPDKIRIRFSYGGDFIPLSDGQSFKYHGGHSYLESIPCSWSYSDLMFRLSEKVGDAVSVKYQLPGEELDPDALISAAEDVYTAEDIREASRVSSQMDMLHPFTDSDVLEDDELRELRVAGQNLPVQRPSWSSFGSNGSSGSQQSSVSKASGSRAASSQHSRPPTSKRCESPSDMVSWHDGFRAGQEAQRFAEECYWQDILIQKLNRATKHCSFSQMLDPEVAIPEDSALPVDALLWAPMSPKVGFQGVPPPENSDWHMEDPKKLILNVSIGEDVQQEGLQMLQTFQTQDPIVLYGSSCAADPGAGLPTLGSDLGGVILSEEPHAAQGKANGAAGNVCLPSQLGSEFGNDSEDGDGVLQEQHLQLSPRGKIPAELKAHPLPLSPEALKQLLVENPGAQHHGGHLDSPPFLSRQWSGSSKGHSVHFVPANEVKVLCKIGEGAFGEVSLATCPIFGKVAVKWLKPGKLGTHSQTFWQEAELLGGLNHPHVIRFFGVVVDSAASQKVVGIITEYMTGGSLSALLHAPPGAPPQRPISLHRRAELALCAVNGMSYLHELKIVHFDLKPDNLLVDGDLNSATVVKVADFGLSKHKYASYVSGCRDLRGTLPYMAPELVSDPDHVSEKADVWSMGIVMWELVARQVPYADMSPQAIVAGLMQGFLKPKTPDWVEDEWRLLMESCLEQNPQARPSFRELSASLERVRDEAAYLSS